MAQQVPELLDKPEDLGLNPQNPCDSCVHWEWGRSMKTGGFLGFVGYQPMSRFYKSPSFKRRQKRKVTQALNVFLWPVHTHT